MWPFKKHKQNITIWITPIMYSGELDKLTTEQIEIIKKIQNRLEFFQNKMCEYNRKNSNTLSVQLIEAIYTINSDYISICGLGVKSFSWEGDINKFLDNDFLSTALLT